MMVLVCVGVLVDRPFVVAWLGRARCVVSRAVAAGGLDAIDGEYRGRKLKVARSRFLTAR